MNPVLFLGGLSPRVCLILLIQPRKYNHPSISPGRLGEACQGESIRSAQPQAQMHWGQEQPLTLLAESCGSTKAVAAFTGAGGGGLNKALFRAYFGLPLPPSLSPPQAP